jgi:hypothetical protein
VCVVVKLLLKVFGKISVSVFNFPPEISLVKSLKVLAVGWLGRSPLQYKSLEHGSSVLNVAYLERTQYSKF